MQAVNLDKNIRVYFSREILANMQENSRIFVNMAFTYI